MQSLFTDESAAGEAVTRARREAAGAGLAQALASPAVGDLLDSVRPALVRYQPNSTVSRWQTDPMPRSIWKGAISFGLVTIPVKLFSATEEKDISFRQVHPEDGGRIKYKRVC